MRYRAFNLIVMLMPFSFFCAGVRPVICINKNCQTKCHLYCHGLLSEKEETLVQIREQKHKTKVFFIICDKCKEEPPKKAPETKTRAKKKRVI